MTILVGISASIAIYKACDLVRELQKAGHLVRVVMTHTAEKWISPVIFHALSGNLVYSENNVGGAMPHIEIRDNLDLFVVAPATADLIARAAIGRADDILTATLLSFPGKKMIAPAMNPFMYEHKATQKNIATLREYGYEILDPASGEVVCGDEGNGKMMSVQEILNHIDIFQKSKLGKIGF